jgi:ABC-type antimicrobial peptide transport system permease subunit
LHRERVFVIHNTLPEEQIFAVSIYRIISQKEKVPNSLVCNINAYIDNNYIRKALTECYNRYKLQQNFTLRNNCPVKIKIPFEYPLIIIFVVNQRMKLKAAVCYEFGKPW